MIPAAETEAALAARAALAQDRAQIATRQARPATVVVVERPGESTVPTPEQERQWCLAAISQKGIYIRPDNDGPPKADHVFVLDGEPRIVRNIPEPRIEEITPANQDAMDYRWEYRRRSQENRLLVWEFGLKLCLERGWIDEIEVRIQRLDQMAEAPPQLPGIAF